MQELPSDLCCAVALGLSCDGWFERFKPSPDSEKTSLGCPAFQPVKGTLPLRCLLVEDQLMIQQLLAIMLGRHPALEVVACASTAAEAIAACIRHRPDLLILDIALPDANGLEVARTLQQHQPEAKVIILSSFASSFERPLDLRETIIALVDKARAYQDLLAVIERLLPEQERIDRGATALDVLTERERDILRLLGLGNSNRAIAERLNISIRTVETHRRNISSKLGVSGAALIHQATLLNQTIS